MSANASIIAPTNATFTSKMVVSANFSSIAPINSVVFPSATAQLLTTATALSMVTYPRDAWTVCKQMNKTGLPDWYLNMVVLPFEQAQCNQPAAFVFNETLVIGINRMTGERVLDLWPSCWSEVLLSRSRFLAKHYNIFYRIPFPTPSTGLGVAPDWFVGFTQFMALYCSPFVLTLQLFGVVVVRNVLRQTDSAHLIIFHSSLMATDMAFYLFSALYYTGLGVLIVLPACMSWPLIALQVNGYVGALGPLLIDQAYCFANLIQALLAVDRVIAVFFPVRYRAHATAKTAVIGMALLLLLSSALCLFDHISLYYHAIGIYKVTYIRGPMMDWILSVYSVSTYLRFAVYATAYVVQAVCCLAVFLKIRWIKRHPIAGDGKGTSSISLLPCVLLIGTCGINLIGTAIEMLNYQRILFPNIVGGISFGNVISQMQMGSIAVCNNIGMLVHFIASRHYRAEAKRLLGPAIGVCLRVFPFCARKRAAVGGVRASEDASSSAGSSGQFRQPGSSSGTASTSGRSQGSTPGGSYAERSSVHHS